MTRLFSTKYFFDLKNKYIFLLLFLSVLESFGQIQSYYNGLDLTKTGNELFNELSQRIISTHNAIPYTSTSTDTWDVLMMADEDPDNALNVLLLYGFNDNDGIFKTDRSRLKTENDTGGGDIGKWNREHIFARSLALPNLTTDSPGPGTDVYNLRPSDSQMNEERSNRKFTDGSGNAGIVSANGGWYPGDEWKGDVARSVLYMYLRYNGDGTKVSETQCLPIQVGLGEVLASDPNMIDLFLKWNVEDPVSAFEDKHNEIIVGIQGNRNPFIDNPYLATLIWGGLNAQDRWDMNNTSDLEAPSAPLNVNATAVTDTTITLTWNQSTDNIEVVDYLIYVNEIYVKTSLTNSATLNNLNQNTEYTITIKARDAASNLSNSSEAIQVKTLEGPIVLLLENFDDCSNLNFVSFNEASDKNWVCETQYGENNSGSISINGYQQNELSKDWLITKNSIDFDASEGEMLRFYVDAAYGNTPLELLYSNNYDGVGNPSLFNWNPVSNVSIPIHSNGGSTEEVFVFNDIDLNELTGKVYFAFKYYSTSEPTRWTVDSFKITATDVNNDLDEDGVLNANDLCPNTPLGETVNANGCSNGQLDDDNDGVSNANDFCPNTSPNASVDSNGCFTLIANNFKVETVSETCPDKNNGIINITATENHSYLATLNGTTYNFINNELSIENLAPGTYNLCITVTGESYEQCYEIIIEEGIVISGKTSVASNRASIEITQGTAPFSVFVNGVEQFETFAPQFDLDVKHGDVIEVKTAIDCEGTFAQKIDLFTAITAYPNPTQGSFEIAVPTLEKNVKIYVYNAVGKLISAQNYPVIYQKVQLSLENQPTGVYFVKIQSQNQKSIQIVKQ